MSLGCIVVLVFLLVLGLALALGIVTAAIYLMPLGLWQALGESWNHWATIPATFVISFFLFGIEEAGIQLEEPFSVLPIEAFCNGAIAAAADEMLAADGSKVFDEVPVV